MSRVPKNIEAARPAPPGPPAPAPQRVSTRQHVAAVVLLIVLAVVLSLVGADAGAVPH